MIILGTSSRPTKNYLKLFLLSALCLSIQVSYTQEIKTQIYGRAQGLRLDDLRGAQSTSQGLLIFNTNEVVRSLNGDFHSYAILGADFEVQRLCQYRQIMIISDGLETRAILLGTGETISIPQLFELSDLIVHQDILYLSNPKGLWRIVDHAQVHRPELITTDIKNAKLASDGEEIFAAASSGLWKISDLSLLCPEPTVHVVSSTLGPVFMTEDGWIKRHQDQEVFTILSDGNIESFTVLEDQLVVKLDDAVYSYDIGHPRAYLKHLSDDLLSTDSDMIQLSNDRSIIVSEDRLTILSLAAKYQVPEESLRWLYDGHDWLVLSNDSLWKSISNQAAFAPDADRHDAEHIIYDGQMSYFIADSPRLIQQYVDRSQLISDISGDEIRGLLLTEGYLLLATANEYASLNLSGPSPLRTLWQTHDTQNECIRTRTRLICRSDSLISALDSSISIQYCDISTKDLASASSQIYALQDDQILEINLAPCGSEPLSLVNSASQLWSSADYLLYSQDDSVFAYDPTSQQSRKLFSMNHGEQILISDASSPSIILQSREGSEIVNVQRLFTQVSPPQMVLRSWSQGDYDKTYLGEPSLSLSGSTLTLKLAAQTSVDYQDVEYRYKIGEEKYSSWTSHSTIRISIPQGKDERLQLQCKTLNGISAPLRLTVNHPMPDRASRIMVWIGLAVSALLLLLILHNRHLAQTRRRQEELNLREKQKSRLLSLENKALQLQMNPHFIFNSLQSIKNALDKRPPEVIESEINRFAKIMRKFLDHSRQEKVSLEDEIELLSEYLELQNELRSPQVHLSIMGSALEESALIHIPPLNLQPFVENALIHAFDESIASPEITISFEDHDNSLICSISDNGIGRRASAKKISPSGHKSHATAIITERLKSHDPQAVQYIDHAGGTTVRISLPILE